MSELGKAVFLSYASQDAEAAKRIADALRAAGVEVWFDQSELVGGDAWDAKIRKQIKDCALLIPIISASTQARTEGYFRLEWRLADQRTHLMGRGRAFLLPVCIDDTKDADADVPDSFSAVQWTRLPRGETTPAFVARVQKLLEGGSSSGETASRPAHQASQELSPPKKKFNLWLMAAVAVALLAAGLFAWRPWQPAAPPAAPAPLSPAAALEAKARALIDDDSLAVRENYKSAAELCERATQLSPDLAEAWATWARANCELYWNFNERSDRQVAALRSQAERALRLAPASIESALAMARYELQVLDDVKSARARLLAVLEKSPAERRALRMLIDAEVDRRKDYAEARRWADRANALPGGDAEALVELAWVYWGGNRLGDVRDTLARSLAIQPTTEGCQMQLMLLIIMGDFEGARRWLQQIPSAILREDRVAMIAYQAQVYAGDYAGAYQLINAVPREILEQGMLFAARGYLAGNALLLAGKRSAAEVEFRAALRAVDERLALRPRDSRVLYQRCLIQARLKDTAEAERLLVTARELGGDDWADREALALLGRHEEALAVFDRVIQRNLSRWFTHLRDLKYDPIYAGVRQLPRGREVIERGERWLAEELQPVSSSPSPSLSLTTVSSEALAKEDKSVAVLAFANLSDDKANEYFSDGISEELLNVLAKVPGLTVRGRSSGFYFKGKQTRSSEIGQQLAVNYLVQGSVRRAGERVRISAQLIRAATDEVVWSSGSIDRDLKDVFALQDEIAGLIAKNLSLKMGMSVRAPHQVNPEALTALLEGRQFWVLRTTEGFARAGVLFRRAVELDPEWAPAHAALANLMTIETSYRRGGGEPVGERFALAAQEAKRAIELDPSLGEPHAALGKIEMENLWHAEAGEEFRRALALEPNNALVRDWYGDLLVTQGRLDLAIVEYRRAADIEPLSPYILWDLAWELMHVRRYRESLALVERAIALTPNGAPRLTIRRARLLLELGRKDEAVAALRPFLDDFRTDSDPQIANEMIWCLQRLGLTPDRERWTADLLRHSPGSFSSGVILLMRGEEDRAYPLLEKCPPIFWQQLYWDPVFDPVRETPRFQQMLEKLGCAAEYKVARETLARLLKEERK